MNNKIKETKEGMNWPIPVDDLAVYAKRNTIDICYRVNQKDLPSCNNSK